MTPPNPQPSFERLHRDAPGLSGPERLAVFAAWRPAEQALAWAELRLRVERDRESA
jgi:hypothetical protein